MIYDLIIIGAGPAGLTAAIRASERGKNVIILEKNDSAGKKLLICGNGRCNITNAETDPHLFVANYMKNPKFMLSMLHNYSNEEVITFFEKNGVALKVEPQKRVFPKSNKASDVLNVLLNKLRDSGVPVIYDAPAVGITKGPEGFCVTTPKGAFTAPSLLLATGGKTKQKTGSTGEGFKFAEQFGHKLIPPRKALYPFEVKELDICRKLSGLSFEDAQVTFINNAGVLFKERGPILFADFGLTGPIMINASLAISSAQMSGLKVRINVFPGRDEAGIDGLLHEALRNNINKSILNVLLTMLPKSFAPVLISLCGIDPEKKANEMTREERRSLAQKLNALDFSVTNYVMVNKSIVTDGGVDLKEVDNKTLESKLVKGLYFAGEILDVTGKTGGFNLQAAWSTGWTVGNVI